MSPEQQSRFLVLFALDSFVIAYTFCVFYALFVELNAQHGQALMAWSVGAAQGLGLLAHTELKVPRE